MTKESLINELIADGYLKSRSVIDAFKAVDRKDFVPESAKRDAYLNTALHIGHKQTISQPLVVAFMLELLELKKGDSVLEIGTGSGWKTALMAEIVDEKGSVYSIERIAELHEFAKKNLAKSASNITLLMGDGAKGHAEHAPYDKIIAAASAEEVPGAWKDQLKIGGRIVAPVRDSIVVIDKIAKEKFEQKNYFGFSFVPLVTNPEPEQARYGAGN